MPELNPSPKIPTTDSPYLSPNPKIADGKVDGGRETPVIVETEPKYENAPDSVQDEKLKLLEQRVAALEAKFANYYTKTETYAKTEVYAKSETYAKTEVYNKTEVYTKAETDAAIEAAVNPPEEPQEPEE